MRKAPARDASWGFLVRRTPSLLECADDEKTTRTLRSKGPGVFLLTLGGQRSAERSEGNPLNQASLSVWMSKNPKDFAQQRTRGVLTDLSGAAVRQAKAIRQAIRFKANKKPRTNGPGF